MSVSVKCPTCGRSVDTRPRISGASAAARALRSVSGSAAYPSTTGPNGSGFPRVARKSSAVRIIHNEFCSHSPEVAPHAVIPCPPSTQPIASGFACLIAAMSRPNWNPGRRHPTHTTRSPKHSFVNASPSAAVANAIPESGCR